MTYLIIGMGYIMTNKEFLKKVDGSRGLLKDILNHKVEVRLKSKNGFTISENFELTELSYMFNPIPVNEDKGALVIEFQIID